MSSSARTGDGSGFGSGSAYSGGGGGGTQVNNNHDMMAVDDEPEHQPSSEEKAEAEDADAANLTPAQSRRKAQNRAAYVLLSYFLTSLSSAFPSSDLLYGHSCRFGCG